jgi:hypothetical protein
MQWPPFIGLGTLIALISDRGHANMKATSMTSWISAILISAGLFPISNSWSADQMVYVKNTIVITKSGTYDFKGKFHVWKGAKWNCNGEKENGPQMLRIEADNVVVKNFKFVGDGKTYGSYGLGDPIHVTTCGRGQGNLCSRPGPKNVVLDGIQGHACEDLITIGSPGADNITVQNSVLRATPDKSHWDKTIQINFGKNIHIRNNRFEGGQRCIRFSPSTTGDVIGNTFNGCDTAVKASSHTNSMSVSPQKTGPTIVTVKNNKLNGVRNEVETEGSLVTIKR